MHDDKHTTNQEIWKPVPVQEFADYYSVSNHGRVRREIAGKNTHAGRILKILYSKKHRAYPSVDLKYLGRAKRVHVHMMVALAFLHFPPGSIGKKAGDYQVDHIDGNKLNNHVDNLEWTTGHENKLRASRNGLFARGSRGSQAKLNEEQVVNIRALRQQGMSLNDIAAIYDIDFSNVSMICLRKTWKHV